MCQDSTVQFNNVDQIFDMLWLILSLPYCALTVNNFNISYKQQSKTKHYTDSSRYQAAAEDIQKERACQTNNCVKYTFTDSEM